MDHIKQLVLHAQQGDTKAFDALFDIFQQDIRLYCISILENKADGEQTTQDTFVSAWQNIQHFRFESPFKIWLKKIARNACLNLRRTKKGQDAVAGKSLDIPQVLQFVEARHPVPGLEKAVVDREYGAHILDTIHQCAQSAPRSWDTMDWDILFLRYEQGVVKAAEIARRLQQPVGTIKYRIAYRINPVLKAAQRKLKAEEEFS